MLIISKFHDYYDPIKALGIDKTVVYKRDTTILPKEQPHIGYRSSMHHSYNHAAHAYGRIIGFCGKLYPLIEVWNEYRLVCAYTPEGAIATMREIGLNVDKGRNWRGYSRWGWDCLGDEGGIEEFFLPATHKEIVGFHLEYKVPVFVLGVKADSTRREQNITLNPRLSAWGFASIIPPVEAFQSIYMYISGVLGTPSPPLVEISDPYKRIAHGHDGKYSFRKLPEGK